MENKEFEDTFDACFTEMTKEEYEQYLIDRAEADKKESEEINRVIARIRKVRLILNGQ